MSTAFDVPLNGFTFADTYFGDTLQTIAARALGDASLWYQLISPNNLIAPFITDDPAMAGPRVLLTGQSILVPAPAIASSTTDPNAVFGIDIQLSSTGMLMTSNGDFSVVSGRDNLKQALSNVIKTDLGEMIYHSTYGCETRSLIGQVTDDAAAYLAAQYAKGAVQNDPRVDHVDQAVAQISGDTVVVAVEAITIAGGSVTVTATA